VTDEDGPSPDERVRRALHEIALRVDLARRLSPPAGSALLQSVVDATVVLFDAEAASIALHDPATDRLVFEVAAGGQGGGVVGLSIPVDEGIAGYVFTTGAPLALADVERDARFGRSAAEQTGYVPRSLVAVPLVDDEGTIGVLEVIDKRADGSFDLRDIELATVFARQAAVAIRAARVERDTATLLRSALLVLAGAETGRTDDSGDVDAVVTDAIATLDGDGDDTLWALADEIARVRGADPSELDLAREMLAVVARRAEATGRARAGRRGR
jgi:GAF domain-containing protein